HVTGSYHQDWLLHETDFNWRVLSGESGPLRAVADIGTHWLDLLQFVTGLKVVSVCADLRTFLPTRQKPKGPAETFSTKLGAPPGAAVRRDPGQPPRAALDRREGDRMKASGG